MFEPDLGRLSAHLEAIVGERHLRSSPRSHHASGEYLRAHLEGCGAEVREQIVEGPHGRGRNIVADLHGSRPELPRWIVGAHYDTVRGSPGADDNGSAVAGLLELGTLLRGARLEQTVTLVGWDMEEAQAGSGSLLGSRAMASRERAPAAAIAGVIALEMIGYRDRRPGSQRFPFGLDWFFPAELRAQRARGLRGDFIAAIGDRAARPMLEALEQAAGQFELPLVRLELGLLSGLIPHFHRSDHAPFWARGVPALMLTDTAEFRNPHYHRPSDTLETLDLDFLGQVVQTVASAIARLAGPKPGGPRAGAPDAS